MTAAQLMLPANRAFDSNGFPEAGATVKLYESGTTTPANFYADSALTIVLGSTLTANAAGRIVTPAYQDRATPFRLKVFDAAGDELDDIDPFYFGSTYTTLISTSSTNVATRTAMAAITGTAGAVVNLTEAGREGMFIFDDSNLSAEVTADTAQGIYVAPSSDTTGASGAWVRKAHTITPFMFGAVGDGVTNDLVALQAFNSFVFGTTARTEYADWTGNFAISGQFNLGPSSTSPENQKYNVGGKLAIVQLTATFESIRLKNLQNAQWKGTIKVTGTGSQTFASRTCGVGICLQQCARFKISGLSASQFWYAGITYDPAYNSNGAELGVVQVSDCGSGHNHTGAGNGLTGNYSGAVNSGSGGSISQITTLTVDTFPAAAITTYTAFNNQPIQIRLNGRPYSVRSMDSVAGTITIFPWIDSTAPATGTFEWVFGGGHMPLGANANVIEVGLLDASRCGIAAVEAALYCSRYDKLLVASCGQAVAIGSDITASSIGLSIDSLYIEGGGSVLEYIVAVAGLSNASNGHYINSVYEMDLTKCWILASARYSATGTVFSQTGTTFGSSESAISLAVDGVVHRTHKGSINTRQGSSIGFLGQTRPPIPVIYNRDSWTVSLGVASTGYNTLFGYSGGIIGFIGSGSNGSPTGTFTFTPPAGGTINGGAVDATASFSGFTEPALFLCEHTDTAQLTWLVRPISGQALTTSSALTPTSVASTGAVTSSSGTAGMGYATGAGGSVVQTTSKSTGVTLNKVCGKITMNAAALAAAAKVSFIVTNSTVAATDVVLVNVSSGGTANAYRAAVTAVAAGSFTITVENITAGSLSEAPVLNFSVIKAVTA